MTPMECVVTYFSGHEIGPYIFANSVLVMVYSLQSVAQFDEGSETLASADYELGKLGSGRERGDRVQLTI